MWEQLATGQTDLKQVVPRQVFTPYCHLLISSVLVVLSYADCLWITGVSCLQSEICQQFGSMPGLKFRLFC